MNIYEQLKKAGVELDSHESDLYAKCGEISCRIIEKYEHRANVRTFTSQIDGKRWYDIPFAYTPFWDKRTAKTAQEQ